MVAVEAGSCLIVIVEMPGRDVVLISSMDLSSLILRSMGLDTSSSTFEAVAPGNTRDQHGRSLRNGGVLLLAELGVGHDRPTPARQSAPANSPPGARHKTGPEPPDFSTSFSTGFDIGTYLVSGLLRSRAVGGDFDGRAVIQETRARGHHLLARPQPFGNEN